MKESLPETSSYTKEIKAIRLPNSKYIGLVMHEDTAAVLFALCGMCTGTSEKSPRGVTNAIWRSLYRIFKCNTYFQLPYEDKSNIYFKDYNIKRILEKVLDK